MIEAYLDESGIQDGARVCLVTGYHASQDSWRSFEKRWNAILEPAGMLECGFHSSEINWNAPDSLELVESLVECIEQSEIFPLGKGIVVREWERLPLDDRRWLSGGLNNGRKWIRQGSPDKSYYLPFQMCVLLALENTSQNTVHYFVGVDKTFAGHALNLFQELLKVEDLEERFRLGSIDFPLSKQTPGLQAADLLCYSFYQHCKSRLRNPEDTSFEPNAIKFLTRLTSRERSGQRYGLLRTQDFHNMLGISKRRAQEKHRRIHEPTRCGACQKIQTQRPTPPDSGCSEGTSHPQKSTKPHTVFRYGRYIESEGEKNVPSRPGGTRLQLHDPRKEAESERP